MCDSVIFSLHHLLVCFLAAGPCLIFRPSLSVLCWHRLTIFIFNFIFINFFFL